MAEHITPIAGISDEEWQVRTDLAACYRLFVKYGWTDLIFTHLSARVPGVEDQYLINPYGLMFDEITASSLLKVDFQGNVISGDYKYNDAGHAIHTAVLMARPDVNVVLHSHTTSWYGGFLYAVWAIAADPAGQRGDGQPLLPRLRHCGRCGRRM